jgi:hypothetical protein
MTFKELESNSSNSSSSMTIFAGVRGGLCALKRIWQNSALRSAIFRWSSVPVDISYHALTVGSGPMEWTRARMRWLGARVGRVFGVDESMN